MKNQDSKTILLVEDDPSSALTEKYLPQNFG
jgi:hypothetical protein